MIDLYIGLRINQYAIVCGPQINGKSTIWKVIAKTINSAMSSNNPNMVRLFKIWSTLTLKISLFILLKENANKEIFKKYSLLANYLSEVDNQLLFPRIITHHLFPNVYNNTQVLLFVLLFLLNQLNSICFCFQVE